MELFKISSEYTQIHMNEPEQTLPDPIEHIWDHMNAIRLSNANTDSLNICREDTIEQEQQLSNLNRARAALLGSGWIDMTAKHGLRGIATYICSGFPDIFAR